MENCDGHQVTHTRDIINHNIDRHLAKILRVARDKKCRKKKWRHCKRSVRDENIKQGGEGKETEKRRESKKQAESKVGKGNWKGRKREKRRSNKNEEDRERERRRLGEKKQENETGMKKGRAIKGARKHDQEQEQECEAKTRYEVIDRRIERELHIKREQQQEGEKTEKERNSEVS